MGPIVRRDFWEDKCASTMEVERGPWSAVQYMVDTVVREQTWIDLYAKVHLHDDFLFSLPIRGKQDDHIEALEYYKYFLPYLVPNERRYLHDHLWDPELLAGNVFVNRSGSTGRNGKIQVNIISCLDWQGAWIGPAFLHLAVPTMFHAERAGLEVLAA